MLFSEEKKTRAIIPLLLLLL